ncbi:hypothetical protein ACRQ4K_12680, partial [Corynebacterium striatum]
NEADHAVLRILVKFPWHVPDFPIYSNGTKPGALHGIDMTHDIVRALLPYRGIHMEVEPRVLDGDVDVLR